MKPKNNPKIVVLTDHDIAIAVCEHANDWSKQDLKYLIANYENSYINNWTGISAIEK